MNRPSKFDYILYCALTVLPIYIDSPLGTYMGAYGYSLTPFVSVVLLVCRIALGRWKNDTRGAVTRKTWLLVIYLIGVNLIALLYWGSTGGAQFLYGENVFLKAAKGCITAGSFACYLTLANDLRTGLNEEQALRPFLFAYMILCIVAIVESSQIPYALADVHFNGQMPYWRPRLLCMESSWTAIQIIVYGGASMYYFSGPKKSKAGVCLVTVSLLLLVLTTGSKSLQLAALIAVVIGLAYGLRRDARWILVALPIVMVLTVYPEIVGNIATNFLSDVTEHTSTATRSYSIVVALLVAITHPFGVGNALYLYYYPQALIGNLSLVPSNFNMSEVLGWIGQSTDESMGAKSALFQYGLYGGIVAIAVLTMIMWEALKAIKAGSSNRVLLVSAILACMAIVLWDSFDAQYCFWALIGLADYYESVQCVRPDKDKSLANTV